MNRQFPWFCYATAIALICALPAFLLTCSILQIEVDDGRVLPPHLALTYFLFPGGQLVLLWVVILLIHRFRWSQKKATMQ